MKDSIKKLNEQEIKCVCPVGGTTFGDAFIVGISVFAAVGDIVAIGYVGRDKTERERNNIALAYGAGLGILVITIIPSLYWIIDRWYSS